MFNGNYLIPVDGDKVFRSPRHGQSELRAIKGIKRIWVDSRDNAIIKDGIKMVKVTITAFNEGAAKACFQKGSQMIEAILGEKTTTTSRSNAPYTGCYCVPMEADKVFRSPKYGQAQLKKNHSIHRIKVDDRENAKKNASGVELVRVWITAPSQDIADACYQEGRQLVIALMEKAKKQGNNNPKLSDDEAFSKATIIIRDIIRLREERGEYDHMDDANISWYINWREERGITNHADLGMTDYEDPRPVLHFDYPLDDWGDYHEKLYLYQQANPDYNVIG